MNAGPGPDPAQAAEADRATVAILAGLTAVVITLRYHGARVGLPGRPLPEALAAIALASFVCFAGPAYRVVRARWPRPFLPSWAETDGVLALFALGALCMAGLATPFLPASPLPLFGLLGMAGAVAAVRQVGADPRPLPPGRAAAFWLVAGLAAVRWSWFVEVAAEERLASSGTGRDLLFHPAIAAMIQTYGVPATGVDGVAFFPYHVGSHWVAAQLAALTGGPLLWFYQSTFRTLTIAFFLSSFLAVVVALRQGAYRCAGAPVPPLRADALVPALLLVATLGLHRGLPLDVLPDYHSSVFGSESFVLAHSFAYAAAGAALAFVAGRGERRRADSLFLALGVPVLAALLGFTKISLMAVTLPVWAYAGLRAGLHRRPSFWIGLALAAGVSFEVAQATRLWATNPIAVEAPAAAPGRLAEYVRRPWEGTAVLFAYLGWPLVFAFSRLRQLGLDTMAGAWAALRAGRLRDVEVVALACLLGFGPGLVGNIAGGGHIYFALIPIFAALAVVLAVRGLPWDAARAVHRAARAIGRPRVEWIVAAFAAAPFVLTLAGDFLRLGQPRPFVELAGDALVRPVRALLPAYRTERRLAFEALREAHPGPYRLLRTLERVHGLPRPEKREALLFIPAEADAYQSLNPVHRVDQPCLVRPFVAPAMAGVALLDGRPRSACVGVERLAYNLDGPPPVAGTSDEGLCAAAAARGPFRTVLVLDPETTRLRRVECGGR